MGQKGDLSPVDEGVTFVTVNVREDALEESTKDIVERSLGLLMALTGSSVGAVFLCGKEGDPQLCVSHRIDQTALDEARTAWAYGRDALASGNRLPCPRSGFLEPVLVERKLVALVYLDRCGQGCEGEIDLVKALIRARLVETPAAAPKPSTQSDEREQLLLLLERNEWNIARVARILKVSRLTVYRRLGRLGVTRPEGFRRYVPDASGALE